MLGVVSQRRSNLLDAEVHTLVEIHEGVGAPEFLPDVLAVENMARPAGQQGQETERLAREVDGLACFSQFTALEVQLEAVESQNRF
jgi:hypothetical protein